MTDRQAVLDASRASAPPTPLRPIQYLGSKARFLPQIASAIEDVAPGTSVAVDLFSGSGIVARHLAGRRAVIAVDVQEYARILAAALLAATPLPPHGLIRTVRATAGTHSPTAALRNFEGRATNAFARGELLPLCDLIEHGSIVAYEEGDTAPRDELDALRDDAARSLPRELVITRYYGGVFFSYTQALELDLMLLAVRSLEDPAARDTALAALLGAASDCVASVGGHFAQPVRPRDRDGAPKRALIKTVLRRRGLSATRAFAARVQQYAALPRPIGEGRAVRADYRDFLGAREEVAVVYADPPYTRDHYSRFYHVLETMALGDEPRLSASASGGRVSPSRGLYRLERHQSPFCLRSQVDGAFEALFAGVRELGASLVLSYSPPGSGTVARPHPRLMTIAELLSRADAHFHQVELKAIGDSSHSRFNRLDLHGDVPDDAEVLIKCRKPR